MAYPQEAIGHSLTYADYLSWPDAEHWELIDGRAYDWNPVGRDKLDPIPPDSTLVALAGASRALQPVVAG